MKRAFAVAPLSANVSPVTGLLMAGWIAHSFPLEPTTLIPVIIMAASSGQMAQLTHKRQHELITGTQRTKIAAPIMETIIVYMMAWNLNTWVQPDE